MGSMLPGYRKVPGVIYARRYRVIEDTSGYSTVYEFESTAVPESPEWQEQQQHSSPNSPRMRQVMTHAPGSAGVYVTGESLKSRCAFHQKDTVPGREQTVRQSARRAIKSHIACSALSQDY